MLKKICISAMILTLTGCPDPYPVLVCDPLPLPAEPVLLPVKSDQLACLSDDIYERMSLNRSFAHGYAKKLRAIIDKHNQGCSN
jgi:hypothetical protein